MVSRPFECRCTESETMLDPALSRRADFASKKSASRPTSCTGHDVLSSVARERIAGSLLSPSTRVLQIM